MAIDKKHPDVKLDGLVELTIHGNTYVLKCEDALEIFNRLQKAVELDYTYVDNNKRYHVSPPKPYSMAIKLLDRDAYIEGLINGAKP